MRRNRYSLSFEFFPPKTPEGMARLPDVAAMLAKKLPDYFSVTFGANCSVREGTIEAVRCLQKNRLVPVAPHLSCTGMSRQALIDYIDLYQQMGVTRIVALRGDRSAGQQPGELKFASELVALIRQIAGDHFHIEVAAYPEVHPEAESPAADIANLRRKFDAGANSAITQYFYNPDAYFYFNDACAQAGITFPIVPGIMPVTQFVRLAKFSDACGAEIPRWMRQRLQAYTDTESLKQFGLEVVQRLCEQLLSGGAPGLHFYTLNQSEASAALCDALEKELTGAVG